MVKEATVPQLMEEGLSGLIDRIQVALGEINTEISATWFLAHVEADQTSL